MLLDKYGMSYNDIRTVDFSGATDMVSALRRGDVDVVDASLGASRQFAQKGGDRSEGPEAHPQGAPQLSPRKMNSVATFIYKAGIVKNDVTGKLGENVDARFLARAAGKMRRQS